MQVSVAGLASNGVGPDGAAACAPKSGKAKSRLYDVHELRNAVRCLAKKAVRRSSQARGGASSAPALVPRQRP
jgi:hypothetical protein